MEHGKKAYLPLIIIVTLIIAVAGVASHGDVYTFLLYGMTGFFLVFGGFKLLDLKGFADGYASYDLLAMRWHGYGYVYPFIELAFGFSMLAGFHPDWLLWSEAALMLFGGIGVLSAMKKQGDVSCACLGTLFKLPLTSVSLSENATMLALATVLVLW